MKLNVMELSESAINLFKFSEACNMVTIFRFLTSRGKKLDEIFMCSHSAPTHDTVDI